MMRAQVLGIGLLGAVAGLWPLAVAGDPPAPRSPAPASLPADAGAARREMAAAMEAYRAGDPATAAATFRHLAEAGHADAQFNLALLFMAGEGVPENAREALYWAWRARLSGQPRGGAVIDRLMPLATEEERTALASRLEEALAPRLRHADGHAMLGIAVVLTEVPPEPDLTRAYAWASVATALAYPGARTLRDGVVARLPAEDRGAAQEAALAHFRDWCAGLAAPPRSCPPPAADPSPDAAAGPAEGTGGDS